MAARQPHSAKQDLARTLANGIGDIVQSNGYARIVVGKRTLVYINRRKAGVMLDFRATALDGAPAPLRKHATVKRDRAVFAVTEKNIEAARTLLQHVAQKAR